MPDRRDSAAGFLRRLSDPGYRLRGEDPSTANVDEARRWERTYDALIAFKRELLALCYQFAELSDPEIARAIQEADIVLLEVQASRFQERRDYWRMRATELAGSGRRGDAA